jgi:hypothetical protein
MGRASTPGLPLRGLLSDEIRGISVGGRAVLVTDPDEIVRVEDPMLHKFPQLADYAAEGKAGISLFRIFPKPSRSWITARASVIRNM